VKLFQISEVSTRPSSKVENCKLGLAAMGTKYAAVEFTETPMEKLKSSEFVEEPENLNVVVLESAAGKKNPVEIV